MTNAREHEPMTAALPAKSAAVPRDADPVLTHRYVYPVVHELDLRRAAGPDPGARLAVHAAA